MSDGEFSGYIESEIKAIMSELQLSDMTDKEEMNKRAIDWVNRNAADFRKNWDRYNGSGFVKE